ncbi:MULTISPECIES: AbrB/MazE/SpoVT family DNA-binding domain-containing protein [Sphingomonas]|uniref:AbrB/MazE/SpoVT family DNA-binding domain-containing protein n=1 Tax=Sphingomonas adhaesiva TaxID=28212 RepID=A0A2A4I7S6_9SPHN|nr:MULTISPECIES: AbrB/MazE/SpoVT family DNA-binding domain-containing protein [Sphingomonas]PCG13853.1 AbrB/MazE/SpoVT family DNA-binding domain-containing protein [Sphingomonas adhaesiva]PZU78274.1 MAG: AbrB/MazE/SpoVT family DNA-binding domain-containing protein [Sphingomonas sp.]
MTYHAKVIAGGKIVIPAALRRELGIRDGDSVVIEPDEGGSFKVVPYAQAVREIQAQFRGRGVTGIVDELIADRREEARREDADRP